MFELSTVRNIAPKVVSGGPWQQAIFGNATRTISIAVCACSKYASLTVLSGMHTHCSFLGAILNDATKCACRFAMRSARHTVVCGAVDQKETEVKTEVTELTVSNPETIKTTEMNFELELERSLFNTRYLAFIGVVVRPSIYPCSEKVSTHIFQGFAFFALVVILSTADLHNLGVASHYLLG